MVDAVFLFHVLQRQYSERKELLCPCHTHTPFTKRHCVPCCFLGAGVSLTRSVHIIAAKGKPRFFFFVSLGLLRGAMWRRASILSLFFPS